MAAKNSKFLRDLTSIASSFIKYFKQKWKTRNESTSSTEISQVIDVMDCLSELDIYRLDFSTLSAFFETSDLVRKLNGFS